MFLGQYEFNVDQKGRLAIPAKYRKAFQDGLVATRGFEHCIAVYPLSTWMQLAQRLASLPQTRSANRRLNRAAFANAYNLDLDKQGRVILPQSLRDWAGVADQATVVGLLNHLEVWGQTAWASERAEMDEQAWQLAEELDPGLLEQ